jgi:AcrR family transcriptional regulator
MTQPGIARRREQRRRKVNERSDERYVEILQAGRRVFRAQGFENTSLKDVADAVGINRSTLYYYISTKEDLLAEILEAPLLDMTRKLREVAALPIPASDRLHRVMVLQMDTFAEYQPEMFVFLADRLHLGRDTDRLRDNAREYGEVLTGIIEDGQHNGEFHPDLNPRVAMLGLLGMSNWVHRWYRPDGPLTLQQIGEQFARMTIEGLRK